MNKFFNVLKRFLLFSFLVWEIVFFTFGSAMPVYAQEATQAASLVSDKINEATEAAKITLENVTKEPAQSPIPASLPIPFDTNTSKVKITSSFGEERQIFTDHQGDKHNGLDFDLKEGTKITAVDDGTVVIAGSHDYGLTVTIEHSWGKTVYGHLSQISKYQNPSTKQTEERELEKGDKVLKGQVIGLSGNTGQSTNPHLHFGIKREEKFIDPAPYLGLANLSQSLTDKALLEATASASLENLLQNPSAKFEDVTGKLGYLYNYKFNLSNEGAIHFQHRKRSEPGFAVVDKEANSKLRFFLKQDNISASALAKVEGNKIEFPVLISGIEMTLRYTLSDNQVKEEFIMKQKPSAEVFAKINETLDINFELENENLTVEAQEKGGYKFNTETGEYWQLLPPNINDNNDKEVNTKSITANLEDNQYSLKVNKQYLENASYPVVIDPTVVVNTSSVTTATQISSQRHVVTTADGTIHNFVQVGTQTATCGGSSLSGLLWFNSTDSGATWTCQGQLSSDTTNLMYADVRADASSNIYVVYSQATNTGGTTKDAFYRKLTKGSGATWTLGSAQTVLDGTATVGYHYATVELEGTTRMWLASRYYDGANYNVIVYYSDGLSDAPTWTSSQTLSTSANLAFAFPTIVRFGSKIGVIYNDQTSNIYKWRFRSDSDGLTSWSSESTAISSTTLGTTFSAVGDSSGNIYVALNLATNVTFTYYNGFTWSSSSTVSSAAAANAFSSITTDGAGSVWVVYGETTGLSGGLSGSRKLVYKKGVAPFSATDFDSSATPVVSYHRTFDKYWSFVSSAYTDDTTDAGNTTSADTQMVTATGDIAYFGSTEVFDSLSWDLSTNGVGGTVAWEYCSAVDVNTACTTWSSLTFTSQTSANASNLLLDGYGAFTAPGGWVQAKVNSESTAYYYVRARTTGNYSTTPVGVQMAAIPQINWGGVTGAISSNSTKAIWTENAVSPMKIRSAAITTTSGTTPSATAEISPSVLGYSSTTATTQSSIQRHLVRTSDGTVHAFIQSASSASLGQLACGSSTSSNNNVGLMWLYSTDSGSSWSCGGQLSSDTTNLMYADARVDSSDNIYVVYSQATTTGGTAKDVFYRKLTKGSGAAWTIGDAQLVLDGTSTVGYHYATLELEGTTRIWLASRYFDGTNYQVTVYYSDGLSATPSWTQSIANLDTVGTNATHYPTMVRFGSKIGVIYNNNGQTALLWRYRADADGLTSWVNEATALTATTAAPTFSAIGDSSGNIYLANNGATNITFSSYNGSSWSSSATVSSAGASNAFVSVSIDTTPNVYVLYGQTTGLSASLSGSRKLVYKKGVSPFATANFDSSATDVVSQHGTFDKVWSFVSASYTDETTDAGNTTSADVTMPSGVGDILYLGKSAKFDSLSFDISTNGTSGQVSWEYYNGSAWMPLVEYMVTSNPTFGGDGYLSFVPHSDWSTTTVNGEGTSYYYVRARVYTAYSVAPVGVQFAAIPQINWASLSTYTQSMQAIWAENALNATKVRYSTIQSFNATPNTPTSLGGAAYVDGSFGTDTTPDLSFTLSDSDGADTLKYQIQIDDSSDFGSPVVDYTSALAAQGSRTFTVGQAAGSGTYTTGSANQTLSDGSYYWRVRATDNGNSTGSYATANSGSIAFKIDTTAPSAPSSVTSTDHTTSTWSNDPTISMSWTAATDTSGSGVAGYYYVFDTSASTIPTSSNSSTASTSVTSSTLSSGVYYFHIRAFDNVGNLTSSGSTVHSGPYFIDTSGPTTPGTPTAQQNPTMDTTPTWSWTASTDSASGLASTPYTVEWSNNSNFSSSSSSTSTTNSFTHSTNLAEGTWYFRVKAVDALGNESSWSSTGSVLIDTTSPNTLGLISPEDGAFINQPRPLFVWQAVSTGGGNSLSSYTFHIDNGSTGDIDISGIPVSGTSDLVTNRYVIKYSGFSDTDENNNYITLYTKSSSDWGSRGNDGKLQEGRRVWSVTAYDSAGNTQTGSRSLYADFTSPTLLKIGVENIAEIDKHLIVTSTKPKITGTISDNVAYNQIQLTFYKENYFLGILTSRTIYKTINHNLNNINNDTTLNFSFNTDEEIDYGKYQLIITGIDKAGNKSSPETFNINVLTYEKAKELLAQKDKSKLDQLKTGTEISIADLEKKAQLRRIEEANQLQKLFAQIRKDFAFIFDATSGVTSQIGNFIASNFSYVPEFIADLRLGVINLASLFNNTATALVMGAFDAGSQMLASSASSFLAWANQGVQYLADLGNNIITGFGSSVYALAQPIFDSSPTFVKTGLTAFLITPFEQGNNYFNNLNKKLPPSLLAEIKYSQSGFGNTFSSLIEANNSITRFADSIGQPQGEYSNTSRYITDSAQGTFDFSKSSLQDLSLSFNNSTQNLNGTISKKFMDQSGLMAYALDSLRSQLTNTREVFKLYADSSFKAAVIASAYLIHPYNQTISFADRTKLWLMTFNSMVLDPNPTQITNVTIEEVGKDYAIISWDTNHVAWGKANYGPTLSYGQEVFTQGRGFHHVVKFTGLEPGKRFFFEVMAEGKNYTYDAYYSFETPK